MPKKTSDVRKDYLDRFVQGKETHLQDFLGCHPETRDGQAGWVFRVWAPHAQSVHLMGEFNGWDTTGCPLSPIGYGVWEIFMTGLEQFDTYKYAIVGPDGKVRDKADPFAFHAETRPGNGSKVYDLSGYGWGDKKWLEWRKEHQVSPPP